MVRGVDFGLLYEMSNEAPKMEVLEILNWLECNDIPMTDTVRRLAHACIDEIDENEYYCYH